jgi:beta-lactamase superfamily II metal-dependent hydrolase
LALTPGTRLGVYESTAPIGAGGMARSIARAKRNAFVKLAAFGTALVLLALTTGSAAQDVPFRQGDVLSSWTPGTLDIHQIVTGRGNAAFMMFPDGTRMLVDAGDAGDTEYDRLHASDADQRPDASRTPAQWIARYVRHMLAGDDLRLDYAVITHFHGDHMGIITGAEPRSTFGDYRLRGITEVAEAIPIRRLVDRGWPDYSYLTPPADQMFVNYRRFIAANVAAGRLTMVGAKAGSATQIVQVRKPNPQLPFEVRIVGVNDRLWTGTGEEARVRFPALDAIPLREDWPDENMCSIALRIKYGRFDYFTGGDMPGYPVPGAAGWHDLETDVARVIGPTDVHVVNHHGSLEEENPFWLSTLRSRVMILPAWAATHPSADVLKRMLSPRVYPGRRDIFVTLFREATKASIGARAAQVASDHGHVVVRVEPGGARYWVLVLDDTTESYRITSVHGPYTSE